MRTHHLVAPFIALVLAGCAGTNAPSETTTSTGGTGQASETATSSADVALLSPDEIVDAAAAVYWSADTTTDLTPREAARRTSQWLTPTLAATLAQDLPGNPGNRWLELEEHSGRYVVTIEDSTSAMPDLPPETPTSISLGRIATLTPVGADGWTGTERTLVTQFDLTRVDEASPWLINKVHYTETYTDPDSLLDFG